MRKKRVRPKKRKKQPFRHIDMRAVIFLLHQQASNWGQPLDSLYEMEIEAQEYPGILSEQLAKFAPAGGELDDLAWAAVSVFAPVGQIAEPTRKALFAQLRKELGKILQEYRGGGF